MIIPCQKKWVYRIRGKEGAPQNYGVKEKTEESDLQKIGLKNNYLSFEGEILAIKDKLQILDMIPVLLKRRK